MSNKQKELLKIYRIVRSDSFVVSIIRDCWQFSKPEVQYSQFKYLFYYPNNSSNIWSGKIGALFFYWSNCWSTDQDGKTAIGGHVEIETFQTIEHSPFILRHIHRI